MNPAEQAQTFFGALLGGTGEQLGGCWLTITKIYPAKDAEPRTQWVRADPDSLATVVTRTVGDADASGIYVGLGLTDNRQSDPKVGRLRAAHVTGLAFLSLDIDIAGDGHESGKPYVPDLATALALAYDLGLEPTVVIHTGHGIQAFYRLAQPWVFGAVDEDDDGAPVIDDSKVEAERRRAADLVWSFVTSVRIRAKQKGGWAVDPTGDLARLVRIPGTRNRKVAGEDLPVEILECDPNRRYDIEQIEAVLAPCSLLDPYRSSHEAKGSLAGADLAGLWAQVQAAQHQGWMPDWLLAVIESGWDDALCRVWSGADDKRYRNDDSAIDQALAAAILRLELGAEAAAQAIMARRCRIGRKVEKADPAERGGYYLDLTISKVAARIAARQESGRSAEQVIDEVMATAPEDDPPLDVSSQPPTAPAVADEPTPSDSAVSLEVAPEPTPHPQPEVETEAPSAPVTPLRRPEPEDEGPPPEVQHADAPKAPRLGLDPSTPGGPDATEKSVGTQLAAQLGLPEGVAIWAVQERRMAAVDEIRVWMVRNARAEVHGNKRWRPNTVRPTRWRPKGEWGDSNAVRELYLHDLGLVVDPARGRAWRNDGFLRLLELARWCDEGTPAEQVRLAVVGMLRRAEGTSVFTTARSSRDPWLSDGHVWVPLDSVRTAIAQAGFGVPKASPLMDILDEMGCKVQSGMRVVEAHQVADDETPWVLLNDELITPELAEHVRLRATDRDAADARSGLRRIQ